MENACAYWSVTMRLLHKTAESGNNEGWLRPRPKRQPFGFMGRLPTRRRSAHFA